MTVEVRPRANGWAVMHVGIERTRKHRKQEAEHIARRLARKHGTELVIYREDMTVSLMQEYPRNNGW